mgnify:CR=1 FL=1
MPLFTVENIKKSYLLAEHATYAINNISCEFEGSKFYCILGPSGSGKSTFLNILAGLEKPDSGHVFFREQDIYQFKEKEMDDFRRECLGFIFQFYNLIPNLTVLENVRLTAELVKEPILVKSILKSFDIWDKRQKFPNELSGGEQQRVSIARAIVKNPDILLCDEPTGALDSKSGIVVLELLKELCTKFKKTVIVVTHNSSISNMADVTMKFKDGTIDEYKEVQNPISAREVIW